MVELEQVVWGKTDSYFLDFRAHPYSVRRRVSSKPDAKSSWASQHEMRLPTTPDSEFNTDQHHSAKLSLISCHGQDFLIKDLVMWLFVLNPHTNADTAMSEGPKPNRKYRYRYSAGANCRIPE